MNQLKAKYWPMIRTIQTAEDCLKNASQVAYFVAGLTAILAILAWYDVLHLSSPWAIIDAALFAVLGFFISRKSRIAAVCALSLYLIEAVDRIASGSSGSMGAASVVVILFTLYFINGVRASFALVHLRAETVPPGTNANEQPPKM